LIDHSGLAKKVLQNG